MSKNFEAFDLVTVCAHIQITNQGSKYKFGDILMILYKVNYAKAKCFRTLDEAGIIDTIHEEHLKILACSKK